MRIHRVSLRSRFTAVLVFLMTLTGLEVMSVSATSAEYSGTGGVTFQSSSYLEMSSGITPGANFTVEAWVRSTDWTINRSLVVLGGGNSGAIPDKSMTIYSSGNKTWVLDNAGVAAMSFEMQSGTMANNSWIFLAVVQDDNGISMWLDGVRLKSVNCPTPSCTRTNDIPKWNSGYQLSGASQIIGAWARNSWWSVGTLGVLRLSNISRVATTSTSYPVPTANMSADLNTKLLFIAPSSGSSFTDSSSSSQTITSFGTPTTNSYLQNQSITFTQPSAMTYGDLDQTLMVSASSNLGVTLASSTSSVCSVIFGKIHVVSVGTCTITANQGGDATYSPATEVSKSITISKSTSTIKVADSAAYTYNGAPQGPSSSTVTGSSGAVTYSYLGIGATTYPSSATKPTNVGTYTVTAVVATDNNYLSSTSSAFTFTIIAKSLSITASSPSVTYGAAAPSVSAASYSGLVNGDLSSVVTGLTCTSAYTTTSAVGSLPATICSGGTASNYTISYIAGSVIINKATPNFSSWGNLSKNYGDSSFTVTAPTVIDSLDGSFSYSSGNTPVVAISGTTFAMAGSGTSVITATFTPTDSINFNSATTSMTVTVSKPTLSVSASSHTVAYGGAIPTITPTISGFVNGEDSSVVTGLSCSTTYTTTTAVGTIGSSCTGATASNYSFSYTSGVITVTQGGQTTPLAISSTSVTYGSTLSLTTTGGNGSGSNSFFIDSGPCTVLGETLTPTAAGTCMVTATKAANGNYLVSSSASTAITVNPKGLTVSGLTGVNKEYDGTRAGAATGTPTLVGVVGSDNVLLGGTPTFTFATANAGNGVSLAASGYTLTGTTAGNYTLTLPTLTANITAKAARVAAVDVTVAFGATVTSGVTASGLISPDAIGSASYTYTGTGTATPPTAVGVYTVTPSNAVLSTGTLSNYSILYDTATVTILAKYTVTYNANGGLVSSASTATVDFVVGDQALILPTPTRANYTFTGWYTLQTNGTRVTGSYTPTATAILWARWVQNSLYGMGSNTKILTITTVADAGNTYSVSAGGGTVAIEYIANALPAGTVIDGYLLSDTSTATSIIGSGNDYVMSLVLAWVATDETVPTTAAGKPITMTITNNVIKRGAKIYSVIGSSHTLLGTATADGSATILITDDPQIIIAITKPDAPTGVSATSGGDASTTVSWTAPSDGGSPITSYTATSNAGQTCTSTTTSCSVTGLTNGTPYTFTVTATNTIGVSDPSAASAPATPVAPVVVTPPSSGGGGGGGGSTYVQPTPEPTTTIDPAIAAAAAAKALADAKAAEEKAAAEAKALAEKRAAEEATLLAQIKALQEKADAEALTAAKKLQEELAATQLKAEAELKAATALKLAEEQRAAAAKKITTVYSTTAAFKLNTTYSKRLNSYTKKIAAGSTVTCIGYAKSSKTLSYAKAKVVATKQAKALCTSMKKINPTLMTKSTVLPVSKAPVTSVNKKWIPVSYRVQIPVN